jgi:hypothetical protein
VADINEGECWYFSLLCCVGSPPSFLRPFADVGNGLGGYRGGKFQGPGSPARRIGSTVDDWCCEVRGVLVVCSGPCPLGCFGCVVVDDALGER